VSIYIDIYDGCVLDSLETTLRACLISELRPMPCFQIWRLERTLCRLFRTVIARRDGYGSDDVAQLAELPHLVTQLAEDPGMG
jgi:hypothetical protein